MEDVKSVKLFSTNYSGKNNSNRIHLEFTSWNKPGNYFMVINPKFYFVKNVNDFFKVRK